MFIVDDQVIKEMEKYKLIMSIISDNSTDISEVNCEFQRVYTGYYFPAQVSAEFKTIYYSYMQSHRDNVPSFNDAINDLYQETGRVDYSFTSKMLHTLDDRNPILDQHVMRLLGFPLQTSGKSAARIQYYTNVFNQVFSEYQQVALDLVNGSNREICNAIRQFDEKFANYRNISTAKKIDCLIFRLRKNRGRSVLE